MGTNTVIPLLRTLEVRQIPGSEKGGHLLPAEAWLPHRWPFSPTHCLARSTECQDQCGQQSPHLVQRCTCDRDTLRHYALQSPERAHVH